jgi:hypothetical protein
VKTLAVFQLCAHLIKNAKFKTLFHLEQFCVSAHQTLSHLSMDTANQSCKLKLGAGSIQIAKIQSVASEETAKKHVKWIPVVSMPSAYHNIIKQFAHAHLDSLETHMLSVLLNLNIHCRYLWRNVLTMTIAPIQRGVKIISVLTHVWLMLLALLVHSVTLTTIVQSAAALPNSKEIHSPSVFLLLKQL